MLVICLDLEAMFNTSLFVDDKDSYIQETDVHMEYQMDQFKTSIVGLLLNSAWKL